MKISKALALILFVLVVFYGPFLTPPKKLKAQVPAGIALVKHVDKNTAAPGDILTYTIDWRNISTTVTYLGVRISDVLPANVNYLDSPVSEGGVLSGNVIYWVIGNAPPNAYGTVSFRAKVLAPNPFGFAGIYTVGQGEKAQALKVNFVRRELWWESVQTSSAGSYDYKPLDDIYDNARTAGFELILNLRTHQNSWGTNCNTIPDSLQAYASCPPNDLTGWNSSYGYSPNYYNYVSAILEHLSTSNRPINYILVENEVNSKTFWHGEADDFLKTRGTVYKAVQDFNASQGKNIQVIDNGIADLVWGIAVTREKYCSATTDADYQAAVDYASRYLKRVSSEVITKESLGTKITCSTNPELVKNDYLIRDYSILLRVFEKDPNLGKPSFDYMSYHFYAPWDTQEEVINWINREMQKNGYTLPVMHTEGGFLDKLRSYTNASQSPQLKQDVANDVVRNHIIALSNGVKAWIWFPLVETEVEAEYKGLYQNDGAELPARTAYKLLTSKLKDFSKIEKIDSGDSDVYTYKTTFTSGQSLYVVWSKIAKNINFSGRMSGNVRVTQVDGTSSEKNSSVIPVSDNPVFIESLSP